MCFVVAGSSSILAERCGFRLPVESVALQAAKSANWGDLANICGHTNGFNQPTIESLQDLWESSPSSSQGGRVCLAIALSSPDFMVI